LVFTSKRQGIATAAPGVNTKSGAPGHAEQSQCVHRRAVTGIC